MAEILGKQEQRRSIWVPDTARPKFVCDLCGKREYSAKDLAGHIAGGCARNYQQVNSLRVKAPILFDPAHDDVELAEWFRKNHDAIVERRLKP